MRRILACIAVTAVIGACERDPFSAEPDERFVVQAYLYAGEPVADVRITATLPLGAADSVAPPVNDAGVALYRNGTRYALVPTPGDSGYYHYPGADLVIEVGDVFDLEVTARGVTATARTTVPPPPEDISLSTTELRTLGGTWATEAPVVRWHNPGRAWFFIAHRNLDPDAEPTHSGTVVLRPGLIVSEPTNADSAAISVYSLRHYGQYRVTLFRVNDEYERLYTSRKQDTRDLNEPATNIHNGIGIFTAFSSRSAYFTLSR